MLSDPDALLIARDPTVSGLSLLLDNEALCAALAEKLPQDDIIRAKTEYLRYKPSNNCLARIRFEGTQGESTAYAMAFQHDGGARLSKIASRYESCSIKPVLFPEHSIAVFPFPLDRRLPSLAELGHSLIPKLVQRAAPALVEGCKDFQFTTLRYKPERRYVAQLSDGGRPIAALKMYSTDGFQRAWRTAQVIGGMGDDSYARCIGHSDRHRTLLFDWIHGTPLSEVSIDSPEAETMIREAAQTLRRFHSIPIAKLPVESLESTLVRLAECRAILSWLAEDYAEPISDACDRIAFGLGETQSTERVSIHGDLHLKQFVVGPDGARLLDFDRTRSSDPAEDLGTLLGNLRRRTINSLDREQFDDLFHCFLHEYEAGGSRVDWRRIEVYAALRLIELAVEPFRSRQPNWQRRMQHFVDSALQLVAGRGASLPAQQNATSRRPASSNKVFDPFNVAADAKLPGAQEAIDPVMASRRFSQLRCVDAAHAGVELKRITVTRHRPGRRCVIEYSGRSRTSGAKIALIGKMNAKKRHQSHFDRQCMLWNAGFGGQTSDGISVARPWGVIPEWQMWLSEKASGHSAWRSLQSDEGPHIAKRIAYALAKLHNAELNPSAVHTIDDEVEILQVRLTAAAEQVPQLSERILRVLDECKQLTAEHEAGGCCPIHRDFYPDQVLVNGKRIVLVDFDLLCSGEGALDVGNFRAHLTEHGLRHPEHQIAYAACDAAFLGEYVRLRPSVTAPQIEVYTVLSLARHVSLCMSCPNFHAIMPRVLDVCDKLLKSCRNPGRQLTAGRI